MSRHCMHGASVQTKSEQENRIEEILSKKKKVHSECGHYAMLHNVLQQNLENG